MKKYIILMVSLLGVGLWAMNKKSSPELSLPKKAEKWVQTRDRLVQSEVMKSKSFPPQLYAFLATKLALINSWNDAGEIFCCGTQFSVDETLLLVTLTNSRSQLFNTKTKQVMGTWNNVHHAQINNEGTRLFIEFTDNRAQLIDLRTNKVIRSWEQDELFGYRLTAHSNALTAIDQNNTGMLFDAETGKLRASWPEVSTIYLNDYGNVLVLGYMHNNRVQLINTKNNAVLAEFTRVIGEGDHHEVPYEVNDNGTIYCHTLPNNKIQVVDLKTKKVLLEKEANGIDDIDLSPDGTTCIVQYDDAHNKVVELIDLATNRIIKTWKHVDYVEYSPNGSHLGLMYDEVDNQVSGDFFDIKKNYSMRFDRLSEEDHVVMSNNGKYLLLFFANNRGQLVEVASGRVMAEWPRVQGGALSSDGSFLYLVRKNRENDGHTGQLFSLREMGKVLERGTLKLDEYELMQAFNQALIKGGYIEAQPEQWKAFQGLQVDLKRALELYIKEKPVNIDNEKNNE